MAFLAFSKFWSLVRTTVEISKLRTNVSSTFVPMVHFTEYIVIMVGLNPRQKINR